MLNPRLSERLQWAYQTEPAKNDSVALVEYTGRQLYGLRRE